MKYITNFRIVFVLIAKPFFAVCKARKEDEKVKIWAKKESQNFQILDEYVDDGDFGYEIYTEPKQMVSWDTTYGQLEASGFVEAYFANYGTKYLRFKYPVRIEGILPFRIFFPQKDRDIQILRFILKQKKL
ncbi:hypothetical protein PFY12_01950 [Chryseobacterium camelliae]|uniref:Uncharacterized protein n=1 Tax=Chryseobacterium camelliae TaxID=1265445 RepID=A0ABY7QNI0_9FLAO|nr:hypothetical protein [Chryseobacterium camelliae]WBV60894.1 hypothetical protein PFY12_01950 [Chryseobacterium camelliae]